MRSKKIGSLHNVVHACSEMNIVLPTARGLLNREICDDHGRCQGQHGKVMTTENEENNVIVVPLGDFAFDRLTEEHIYAYPASSDKKIFNHMAFYRPDPVGAVTHYGHVELIEEGDIDMTYRAICFGDRANEDAILVYFTHIEELDSPVKGAGYGVQGRVYTNLDSLLSAEILQEL